MPLPRIAIERPKGRASFEEFARLPYYIYNRRDAWWPPDILNEIDLLSGRSPLSPHLEIEPLCARSNGKLVARVSVVINDRYNRHWNERIGQLVQFEALPDQDDAVAAMLEQALARVRERGMTAARTGFAAFLDYPYAIDNYNELPSFLLRGNPPYYHRYLKNAGFETEKGQTDYTAALTDQMLERYRGMVEAAGRGGAQIVSWRRFGFLAAVDAWTDVTNSAFERHWGWNPVSRAESRTMLSSLWDTPVADLSVLAVADGEVVGAVFSVPDMSATLAYVKPGTRLAPERGGGTRAALINIGVIERARGRGIARAMAAQSFLEMARRGAGYAGYTLVLDDNWASRRTAESLGAHVTSNFLTYRHKLASPGGTGDR